LAALELRDRVEDALALLEGRLHRVVEAAVRGLDHDAVDDDRDVVLALLVEVDVFVEVADLAVDPGAGEAALARVGQHFPLLALALLDERREQGKPGSFGELRQLVGDLLRALLAHPAAADGAVLLADRGVKYA